MSAFCLIFGHSIATLAEADRFSCRQQEETPLSSHATLDCHAKDLSRADDAVWFIFALNL